MPNKFTLYFVLKIMCFYLSLMEVGYALKSGYQEIARESYQQALHTRDSEIDKATFIKFSGNTFFQHLKLKQVRLKKLKWLL